jgi:hypothetical protein
MLHIRRKPFSSWGLPFVAVVGCVSLGPTTSALASDATAITGPAPLQLVLGPAPSMPGPQIYTPPARPPSPIVVSPRHLSPALAPPGSDPGPFRPGFPRRGHR